jgi:hypothetical protein
MTTAMTIAAVLYLIVVGGLGALLIGTAVWGHLFDHRHLEDWPEPEPTTCPYATHRSRHQPRPCKEPHR